MKTQIVIDLDDSLIEMIGKKEYDTSQYLNQMLWRELVLENDMNYFNNLDKIKFSDTSWEFKSTDTQIDSDFKFLQKIYVKETDQFHNWLNKFSDGYRKNIINTLKNTQWKVKGKGGAAEVLKINPSTLLSRMKKLNITRPF